MIGEWPEMEPLTAAERAWIQHRLFAKTLVGVPRSDFSHKTSRMYRALVAKHAMRYSHSDHDHDWFDVNPEVTR